MQENKNKIQALILDMDGVIWKADQPIGDLEKTFALIRSLGLKFVMATNNSLLTIEDYQKKLASMKVTVSQSQIINSSKAVAQMIKEDHPEGGPVFVVGGKGLFHALEEKGFYHSEEKAIAVVAGLDHDFSYKKMKTATLLIRSGADLYGSNPDTTFPTPEGQVPGAGSIIAAIETASGKKAKIAGKPLPFMMKFALDQMKVSPENTLVVGDRLETDIKGGQNMNCLTALVLSGVSDEKMAKEWQPQPDYISENLYTFISSLSK